MGNDRVMRQEVAIFLRHVHQQMVSTSVVNAGSLRIWCTNSLPMRVNTWKSELHDFTTIAGASALLSSSKNKHLIDTVSGSSVISPGESMSRIKV